MSHDRLHYDVANFRYTAERTSVRLTDADRQRIAEDTERFLARGGQIRQVAQGVSGRRQWTLQESVNNEAAVKCERDGR